MCTTGKKRLWKILGGTGILAVLAIISHLLNIGDRVANWFRNERRQTKVQIEKGDSSTVITNERNVTIGDSNHFEGVTIETGDRYNINK